MGLKRLDHGSDDHANEGSAETVWIDTNGARLKLLQPKGAGPLMDILRKRGDGHPYEIVSQVDDLEGYIAAVNAQGGQMDSEGSLMARFLPKLSRGINITVIQS